MRIVAFGDSFTAGEGTNYDYTETLSTFEEREKYQRSHSWPKYLSDLMEIDYVNNGEVGSTNYRIFSNIFEQYSVKKIKEDDLIIIMWSSPIRDHLPFFPNIWSSSGPIGLGWSLKELSSPEAMQKFSERYFTNMQKNNLDKRFPGIVDYIQKDLTEFMITGNYFKYFMNNVYDENYYKTLSTNYLVFLQKYFEWKNQKYIMCDAFDEMVFDTNLVDTNFYYRDKTASDILGDDGGDVYEKGIHKTQHSARHPNINGHKLISKKLFEFITKTER